MSDISPSLKELQEQVWDEFWTAGSNSGHLVRDCEHGVTFFGTNEPDGDWQEGEKEDLLKKAESQPDKYVAVGGVHFSEQYGHTWSWDCERCLESALKHQRFLWNNRHTLSSFLNRKLEAETKRTAKDQKDTSIKI